MNINDYKKAIITLIETSEDIEYLISIYSFAAMYPDKSKS